MSSTTNLFGLLLIGSAAGCTLITHGGRVETETRSVPTFDAVDVNSAIEATITVDPSAAGDVELQVSAESHVLDRIETDVARGTLWVDVYDVVTTRPMRVWGITSDLREARASNAASLDVLGVSAQTFEIIADNAAYVEVYGSTATLVLTADTAAYVSADQLAAAHVTVDLASGAAAEICATGTVTGRVTSGAHLTVRCGGDASRVTTASGGSVSDHPFDDDVADGGSPRTDPRD